MSKLDLSRRDVLFAATGIAVTQIAGSSGKLFAQSPDPLGKELIFRTTDPRNGEPSLDKLVQSWITPVKHFYVRSHAPNPKIDQGQYRLSVEGLVRKPTTFSFDALTNLTQHTITATLTCAGNRRAEFNKEAKVGGVQWGPGAIGNATWTGVALADVLKQAEVLENAKHVWFEGLDEIKKGGGIIPFGGSIPIQKALIEGATPGALLAHKMNGQPLSPDHGYPMRTIVPGYVGARSVKWLGKIVVSDKPSPNHYLATAYKIVNKTDPIDWTESGPIYRFPINGAIAMPESGAQVAAGTIELSGYTLPTGRAGSKITKVLISADNGKNWKPAKLTGDASDYCWQLWKGKIDVTPETKKLVLKAHDSSGAFMPGRVPWNAKGYLQNSWYQLPIQVS